MTPRARLTPWFPASVKPVHVGYYRRNWGDKYLNSIPDYWDGEKWLICVSNGGSKAVGSSTLDWRGLAEKSE